MDDSDQRRVIARSEIEAAVLLARSMRERGNLEATTKDLAGGTIVSLGPNRYVNRLLCSGPSLEGADLDSVIDFFASRELAPSLQISSAIDARTRSMLEARGFEVEWERCVVAGRSEPREVSVSASVEVCAVSTSELGDWLAVLAAANGALEPSARRISDEFGRAAHGVSGGLDFLARVGGAPAACGSLQPALTIAWLGGAATVHDRRGQGLQQLLIDHRMDTAWRKDIRTVAATAAPNSASLRNLTRVGLDLVDTQSVWTRRS